MSDVKLVMGPPASSKSTLAKSLLTDTSKRLNRDKEGGTIADLLPKLEECLKNNQDVVLDNLFATIESRKPFIELCKKYNSNISCYLMDTSIEDSQFNAVQRMIDINGKLPTHEEIKKSKNTSIFPIVVLFKYKKEYQKPTLEEGFSKIEKIKFIRKENPEFVNKALILDYDSTLRICVGGNGKYPVRKEEIQIMPNRIETLQKYKDMGYILLGCSNQSGVSKGELTMDQAKELFDHTNKLLGHEIDVSFCQHQSAPPTCYCRKPQVAHGVDFINRYKLNRKECLFVGDYKTDESFSKRCGFKYVDQAEFFK